MNSELEFWIEKGVIYKDGSLNLDNVSHIPAVDEDKEFGKIIGNNDTRYRVDDFNQYPYSSILLLLMDFSGRIMRGTGFLVGKDTVLTAGHCIYDQQTNEYVDHLVAVTVPINEGRYLGICTRFHCSNRYTILKDKSDDWAIVKIDEPLGDRLEIIPMIYSTMIQTNQAMQVEIPGFPGEVQGRVTFDMWTATDTHLVLPNNEKLQYVITTSGGQSGAPVLISQPSVFGEASYYAVGIHTSGGNQCNYARAIDRDLYDTIWTFWI